MALFWQFCCGAVDDDEKQQQREQYSQLPLRSLPISQNLPLPPQDTATLPDDYLTTIDPPDLPPPSYTAFDPHPPGCNCEIHINRVSRPTIVELFEAQGCNSCPPTSNNIRSVLGNSDDPNLLVLDYHVTYWDHLGWKDIYGKDACHERQWDYARRRGDSRVYTPQVVVNGVSEGVGQTDSNLKEIIKKGQKARKGEKWAQLELVGDRKLVVKGPSDLKGIVSIVTYDPRLLAVDVKDGENRGKRLIFTHVVRNIEQIEDWNGGEQLFELPSLTGMNVKWRRAALVQQGRGGPIIGAARI
jgi:hypothetical protein